MTRIQGWALLAALAVGLVACSSGAGTEAEVRPFSEVQASEFSFEADPTNPERGLFHVTTTEPMICAIVWGEGDDFGNFNNSLDMAGTGIVQHDVLLPGAEPGVEYRFVVQGTTADGTLYRSEVSTFTIPESEAAAAPTEPNLAEGAEVVDVSSEFNEAFGASHAVDGDLTTEWSTSGDGDDASITIDLGGEVDVGGIQFLTRSMTDGSSITETFTVTVDQGETLGPFDAGNPAEPRTAEVSVTGQVFRFDVENSTGGNTGAVELRLLGD
ncbi:MAG: discoidin domain-containing protein [Actinomycetota bacterium]